MIPVGAFPWQSYNEQTPTSDDSDTLAMEGLYEQLNITRDASDYLWYLTDVNIAPDEGFLNNGQSPFLTIISAGPYLAGNEPLALDMSSMGKGQIWINDEGVGRHWPGYIARGDCSACHYSGIFKETKCQSGCGQVLVIQSYIYTTISQGQRSVRGVELYSHFARHLADSEGISNKLHVYRQKLLCAASDATK
ncbi:hypothetical protein RJ640_029759 [Escallonia rubra]|uniref:Beta-galactosidase galactose-binding domain-containing protein n=1 Tax=Escallonia rubra TaxID=112253 RepID=A0AA88QIB1_9ASTE|nr:hypothetical protein RJ640_029759 [Escallonia rubra]